MSVIFDCLLGLSALAQPRPQGTFSKAGGKAPWGRSCARASLFSLSSMQD